MTFYEQLLLAFGGYIIHFLKMWLESIKRKEKFIVETLYLSVAINVISIFILIYIGGSLPADILVMSPLTCVLIGSFNSSMLGGIINLKKPKDINDIE